MVVSKQPSAGGARNRGLGTQALRDTTGNCSTSAVCPEKGEWEGRGGGLLDVEPPCPHSPIPPPSLCSLHITPSIPSPPKLFGFPPVLERDTISESQSEGPSFSHLPQREPWGSAISSPGQRRGTPGPWGPGWRRCHSLSAGCVAS